MAAVELELLELELELPHAARYRAAVVLAPVGDESPAGVAPIPGVPCAPGPWSPPLTTPAYDDFCKKLARKDLTIPILARQAANTFVKEPNDSGRRIINSEPGALRSGRSAPDSRLSLLRELGEQAVLETIFREGPITRPEIAAATSLSKPTVSAAGQPARARRSRPRRRHPPGPARAQAGRLRRQQPGRASWSAPTSAAPTSGSPTSDLFGEPICDLKRPTTKDGSRAVGVQILEMVSEVDRPGRRHPRSSARARHLDPRRRRSVERPGHARCLQRDARGRLRSARGDPRSASTCRCSSTTTSTSRPSARSGSDSRAESRRWCSSGSARASGWGSSSTTSSSAARTAPPARSATCRSSEIRSTRATSCTAASRTRSPPPGSWPRFTSVGAVARDGSLRRPRGVRARRSGDTVARAVVDHVASRLGAAIATVCAILDPELVVLGGGIGASPLLLRPVRGAAAALVPITARIETSLLGDRAALQGAIAVALQAARTQLLIAEQRDRAPQRRQHAPAANTRRARWPRSRSTQSASATATARSRYATSTSRSPTASS